VSKPKRRRTGLPPAPSCANVPASHAGTIGNRKAGLAAAAMSPDGAKRPFDETIKKSIGLWRIHANGVARSSAIRSMNARSCAGMNLLEKYSRGPSNCGHQSGKTGSSAPLAKYGSSQF
jgi:hypothetical protein